MLYCLLTLKIISASHEIYPVDEKLPYIYIYQHALRTYIILLTQFLGFGDLKHNFNFPHDQIWFRDHLFRNQQGYFMQVQELFISC